MNETDPTQTSEPTPLFTAIMRKENFIKLAELAGNLNRLLESKREALSEAQLLLKTDLAQLEVLLTKARDKGVLFKKNEEMKVLLLKFIEQCEAQAKEMSGTKESIVGLDKYLEDIKQEIFSQAY